MPAAAGRLAAALGLCAPPASEMAQAELQVQDYLK